MINVHPLRLEELPQTHHANAICCGYARGCTVAMLAHRHGVSERLVEDVLAGRRYGHLTGRGPLDPTLARPTAGSGLAQHGRSG